LSELLTSLLLGLVQGVTEFLPVSSSGHLAILEAFAGIKSDIILLNVLLHAGTLAAIVVYYRRALVRMAASLIDLVRRREGGREGGAADSTRLALNILVADAVTAAVAFPLYGPTETLSTRVPVIGWLLVVTALLLILTRFVRARGNRIDWKAAAFIGLLQGLAVLPGISRSGATIFAALMFTTDREEAVRFSFLAAVPVLLGAALVEGLGGLDSNAMLYLPGVAVAFLAGLGSLFLLERVAASRSLHWFALYLIPAGLALAFMAG
jgi:undecaprenyl-diphosphatase